MPTDQTMSPKISLSEVRGGGGEAGKGAGEGPDILGSFGDLFGVRNEYLGVDVDHHKLCVGMRRVDEAR